MSPSRSASSVDELLRQLKDERTIAGRVRVVGRSWRLLEGLAPAERERVALQLGSHWIWRRLERLFQADGRLSPWEQGVKQALERMEGADPAELREIAAGLREGNRRGLRKAMLGTLRQVLEAEAEAQEREEQADEALAIAEEVEELEDGESEAEEESAEAEPPPTPVSAPAAKTAPVPKPVPRAAPPPRLPAPPPPPRPVPAVSPRAPSPVPAPAPPLAPARTTSVRERLALLRSLHRAPGRAARLDANGRRELLRRIGGGWAARRALSQLIRSRALDDLDEALARIGELASPVQQTWCLGDLVEREDLDAEDRERILDAAPTPAARRRLERRLGRRSAAGDAGR